jgi:hypothetical protein
MKKSNNDIIRDMKEEAIQPSKDTRALPQERRGGQATIKVCLHRKCCQKGAEDIYKNLKEGLTKEEAVVLPVYECFGYCSEGPNIAINDNIVKGVRPFTAIERCARSSIIHPAKPTASVPKASMTWMPSSMMSRIFKIAFYLDRN